VRFAFDHQNDRTTLAVSAMRIAREAGLTTRACWEVATSVAELVSNATRYAGGGELEIRLVSEPRRALEVVVRDRGPGLPDADKAVMDGWSRGRWLAPDEPRRESLGTGLGAVLRLMSEMKIESTIGVGTTVTARKWIP
jgi:serine/threonine-protein kinase RsbT